MVADFAPADDPVFGGVQFFSAAVYFFYLAPSQPFRLWPKTRPSKNLPTRAAASNF